MLLNVYALGFFLIFSHGAGCIDSIYVLLANWKGSRVGVRCMVLPGVRVMSTRGGGPPLPGILFQAGANTIELNSKVNNRGGCDYSSRMHTYLPLLEPFLSEHRRELWGPYCKKQK